MARRPDDPARARPAGARPPPTPPGTLLTMTPARSRLRVVALPDPVDGVGHGADAAQAEGRRLDHDDGQVGGGQPGGREVAQRGRAVDEDGVVAVGQAGAGPCAAAPGPGRLACSHRPSSGLERAAGRPRRPMLLGRTARTAAPVPALVRTSATDAPSPSTGRRPGPSCCWPEDRGRRPAPGCPAAMAAEASPSVTEVLPTPPFWFTMATIAPMGGHAATAARGDRTARGRGRSAGSHRSTR